jgi:hypothetical protein
MSTIRDRRRSTSGDNGRRADLGVLIALGSVVVFWTALGVTIWWLA